MNAKGLQSCNILERKRKIDVAWEENPNSGTRKVKETIKVLKKEPLKRTHSLGVKVVLGGVG